MVIDTITNSSDFKSHDTVDAKKQFKPLQDIAKRTGVAIICGTHLNAAGKTVGRRADEKVRTAIRMERPDPDGQPNRRRLYVSKSNSLLPPALGITMGTNGNEYDDTPPVAPDGEGPYVGQPAKKGHRSNECMAWLVDLLEDGAKPFSEIKEAAIDKGFGMSSLYEAKRKANIVDFPPEGPKWWELPEDNSVY